MISQHRFRIFRFQEEERSVVKSIIYFCRKKEIRGIKMRVSKEGGGGGNKAAANFVNIKKAARR